MFRDLESGLRKDLKDGERGLRRANAGGARGVADVQIVRYAPRKGRKTNRTTQKPVSLRTAEDEQLHHVKRMIRGIGHGCSRPILKLEICKIQFLLLVNLWVT